MQINYTIIARPHEHLEGYLKNYILLKIIENTGKIRFLDRPHKKKVRKKGYHGM